MPRVLVMLQPITFDVATDEVVSQGAALAQGVRLRTMPDTAEARLGR